MGLDLAIVADDLTGALDAAAPFVAQGLRMVVAISPAHLGAALALGLPGVAVSTASRALAPAAAARLVGATAGELAASAPRIVFKKVDSRLKGHPGAETQAMLLALGRRRVLAAPAVPDLGRIVRDGCIEGFGVAAPIAVRACFAALACPLEVPDTADTAALEEAAASGLADPGSVLMVGARGLAAALAATLARPGAASPRFVASSRTLFAIGSRDPITLAQIARLRAVRPDLAAVAAPDGLPPDDAAGVLYHCTDGGLALADTVVASRFAAALARRCFAGGLRTLVACGGDTAAALLEALGAGVLLPQGEVLPGMPWSRLDVPGLGSITLVTKSGGFGGPDALLAALADKARSLPSTRKGPVARRSRYISWLHQGGNPWPCGVTSRQ
jgi:uncharacterized protein YgbK (DUF1537 family)